MIMKTFLKKLKFDCPLCGERNGAYISQTYTESVVHKCDKVLQEVGTFKNQVFTPLNSISHNLISFLTDNLTIQESTETEDILSFYKELQDSRYNEKDIQCYLRSGKILKVYDIRDNFRYVLWIKDKELIDRKYFTGKGGKIASRPIIDEVLIELYRRDIINAPFPLRK